MTREAPRLIRGIGAIGGSFIVLNGMIGAGIFALPADIAKSAGALSPWLFIASGLLVIFLVLAFAELGSYFRESGGPVLYVTTAFGPFAGFGAGWLFYISRVASLAANSHVLAVYLGTIWAWFDTDAGHSAVVTVVISSLTLINVLGVRNSVRTLSMFTFFKVIPLLMLVVLSMQFVDKETLFPSSLPSIDDPGGTMLLLFYAFIGFEAISMTAGETKRPRRTIPRSLVRMVLVVAVLYFFIMLAYVAVMAGDLDSGATLADVAGRLAGPVGAIVIALTAVASVAGNLNGSLLSAPRLSLAMADHHLLPHWFGRIHGKYSSPANSILFFGGIALLVALTGTFVKLAIASTLTRLIVYGLSIAALPVIKRRADEETRRHAYRLKGGYTIPLIALGLCVWMASYSSAESWRFVGLLLAVGLVLFGMEKLVLKRSTT